jgi:hypothetical protein
MSMVALLGATKQTIQTMLGLTAGAQVGDQTVDITDEGQPKPMSGDVFYGIIGNGFSNSSDQYLKEEDYGVDIIITMRTDVIPSDQIGNAVLTALKTTTNTGGLWARVEELRAYLNMNYDLLDLAGGTLVSKVWTGGQTYSIPSNRNGFWHPLQFTRATYLGVKGPDWFWAEGRDPAPTGVAARVSFGYAARTQTIESQA